MKETNIKYLFYAKEQLFSNDLKLTYLDPEAFFIRVDSKGNLFSNDLTNTKY